MFMQTLRKLLISYSQLDEQTIISSFQSLKILPSSVSYFNRQLQQILKLSFKEILSKNNMSDLCSLLQILLIIKSKGVKIYNKTILHVFDWSLQCLGSSQKNICKIMTILQQEYKCLGKLQNDDTLLMHKIINRSLKVISINKQNYILRGKLHMLLANILKFAHPSGIIYNSLLHKSITKCITFEQYEIYYKNTQISYNFYHKYWQLYKKIRIHPQEDQIFSNKFQQFTQKILNISNRKAIEQFLKLQKCLLHSMQDIQKILKQIINYFKIIPLQYTKQNSYSYSYSHPYSYSYSYLQTIDDGYLDIDLSPIPLYLMKYQNKQQFRMILMTQVQAYCLQLRQMIYKHTSQEIKKILSKGKIITNQNNKNQSNQQKITQFLDLIKQSIKNMEDLSISYMNQVLGQQKRQNLINTLKMFFINQKIWDKIKNGHKRDVFKVFSPQNIINATDNQNHVKSFLSESLKNQSIVLEGNANQSQLLNFSSCSKKLIDLKQQAINKLGITTQNTQNFLKNNSSSIKIRKRPTSTSFAYYYRNASLCLQTFNWQQNTQQYFQTQQDYNVFEWKAMRSLCRQNIKGINLIDEDSQSRGDINWQRRKQRLKLMAFMEEYQSQLGIPYKKVKLNIQTQAEQSTQI